MFYKKGVIKNLLNIPITGFLISVGIEVNTCNYIKKDTLAKGLCCKFREIFRSNFFNRKSSVIIVYKKTDE